MPAGAPRCQLSVPWLRAPDSERRKSSTSVDLSSRPSTGWESRGAPRCQLSVPSGWPSTGWESHRDARGCPSPTTVSLAIHGLGVTGGTEVPAVRQVSDCASLACLWPRPDRLGRGALAHGQCGVRVGWHSRAPSGLGHRCRIHDTHYYLSMRAGIGVGLWQCHGRPAATRPRRPARLLSLLSQKKLLGQKKSEPKKTSGPKTF